MEVLISDVRFFKHMLRHIKTLEMEEEEAKADYARHNKEVLEHVGADKVKFCLIKKKYALNTVLSFMYCGYRRRC